MQSSSHQRTSSLCLTCHSLFSYPLHHKPMFAATTRSNIFSPSSSMISFPNFALLPRLPPPAFSWPRLRSSLSGPSIEAGGWTEDDERRFRTFLVDKNEDLLDVALLSLETDILDDEKPCEGRLNRSSLTAVACGDTCPFEDGNKCLH